MSPAQRVVWTLAGNGSAGNDDGAGDQAQFMFPIAVAYDKTDGSTYVSDYAGQRIRRISRDGAATTVAGSGPTSASGLDVEGGYLDGPALQAKFDHPAGIALGSDRSIYVADSLNHCIRLVANGRVTTFAGLPGTPGAQDGPIQRATFREPRGLAFDTDGTLYVADYGVGVRVISRGGVVSTLSIPEDFAKTVSALSVWQADDHALFIVGRLGLLRYNIRFKKVDGTSPPIDEENVSPYGVVALSNLVAAVSSPRYEGIYMHHGQGPTWELIAGQTLHDPGDVGGFSDGPPSAARFYAPLGLATAANGDILVADAGNRRIRVVPNEHNPYWPQGPGDVDPSAYRIGFISNSFAFKNTFWDESIEAILERRLNEDRSRLGIPRPVKVATVTFADAPLKAQAEYIEEVLGAGNFDLVILSLNSFFFHDDSGLDWYFKPPNYSPANQQRWLSLLEHMKLRLSETHTQIVLADHPFGYDVGPTEDVFIQEDSSLFWHATNLQTMRLSGFGYDANREMERLLSKQSIAHFSTFDRFLAFERRAHRPLFPSADFHFSTLGDAFYAEGLSEYLERLRPWQTQKASGL